MNRLNFNHFYYFYVVGKLGSIKEASSKLHVSQPTISDQLKLLEEYFDTKLFDRKSRSLILTPQGEVAMKYAQKIFNLEKELTVQLKEQVTIPKTSVDIGITHYMSHYFLHEMIFPLLGNENVAINMKEGERRYLLSDLDEGRVDILFTDTKEGIGDNFTAYRIGVNKTFVLAHKKFAQYKNDFPASLNEIPFFNYTEDSPLRHEIELFFMRNALNPRIIGEANDIDMLELVTKSGNAFTIVPEVSKKRLEVNEEIITLGEIKELQTEVYAVVRSNYRGEGLKIITPAENI